MSDSEALFEAFRNWLPKEAASFGAAVARHGQLLKNVGQLAGVGGMLGALGGGGYGAREGYTEARDRGEGRGHAALEGVLHGLGGAAKGGLLGAAAGGAVGGVASKALNPNWLTQREGLLGAGARFGQRQVHSLTGVLSPKELEGVRGGAFAARQGHEAAQKALHEAWIKDPSSVSPTVSRAVKAKKGLEAAEKVQQMGLTSIPGYLNSVKEHGLRPTLQASVMDQVRNMHPGMAAMTLGLPAVGAARALIEREPEQGEGKGERVGKTIGSALGGLAGAAMPLSGAMVMGGALEQAGDRIGRGVDRLRGRKAPPTTLGPPPLEPAEGQHMPSERIMSPAAAGQQPDIGSVV